MLHRSTRIPLGRPVQPGPHGGSRWPAQVWVLMLGVGLAVATIGCAAPPRRPAGPALPPVSEIPPPRSDITAPEVARATDNAGIEPAGSDTSTSVASITSDPITATSDTSADSAVDPVVDPTPPTTAMNRQPPDPVARRLAAELVRAAGPDAAPARIGVTGIRNFSRRSPAEFAAMNERLAGLLNEAVRFDGGGAHPADLPRFTADPADGVSHVVGGTAYLRIAGGIELWELYLTLASVEAEFTIWEASTPIALRRAAGFQGPQLLAPLAPARADADDDS